MESHEESGSSGRYKFRQTTLNDTKATIQSEKQKRESLRRTPSAQPAKRKMRGNTTPTGKKISRRTQSPARSLDRAGGPAESQVPEIPKAQVQLRSLDVHITLMHSNLVLPVKEDGNTTEQESDDNNESPEENSKVVHEMQPHDIVVPALDPDSDPSLEYQVSSPATSNSEMTSVVSVSTDDRSSGNSDSVSTEVSVIDSMPVGAEAKNIQNWLNDVCGEESSEDTEKSESNPTVTTTAVDSTTTEVIEEEQPDDSCEVVFQRKVVRFLEKNPDEDEARVPEENPDEEKARIPEKNLSGTKLTQEVLPNCKLQSSLAPSKVMTMTQGLPEAETSKQKPGLPREGRPALLPKDVVPPPSPPPNPPKPNPQAAATCPEGSASPLRAATPNVRNTSVQEFLHSPQRYIRIPSAPNSPHRNSPLRNLPPQSLPQGTLPQETQVPQNVELPLKSANTPKRQDGPSQILPRRILEEKNVPEPDSTSQNGPEVDNINMSQVPQDEPPAAPQDQSSLPQQQQTFWTVPHLINPETDGEDKYSHVDTSIHDFLQNFENGGAGGNSPLIYDSDDEVRFQNQYYAHDP